MDYLKVSSKSSPASVAGAIAGLVKDGKPVEIQSVGAGAVNQAVKAIAIARGFLIPTGTDIVCAPIFQDIEIDGERRTAIRLSVLPHPVICAPCPSTGKPSDPSEPMASTEGLRPAAVAGNSPSSRLPVGFRA